jgi:hypothetical protein
LRDKDICTKYIYPFNPGYNLEMFYFISSVSAFAILSMILRLSNPLLISEQTNLLGKVLCDLTMYSVVGIVTSYWPDD